MASYLVLVCTWETTSLEFRDDDSKVPLCKRLLLAVSFAHTPHLLPMLSVPIAPDIMVTHVAKDAGSVCENFIKIHLANT